MSDVAFDVLAGLAKVLFIIAVVVLGFAPVLTLAERKISAWMQDRIGPNRAHFFAMGGKPVVLGGLFHTLADAVKMLTKEYTMPAQADRLLFTLAPIIALFPALMMFAAIPFGPPISVFGHTVPLQIANINVGVLYIFALGSLGVYGAAIAGWASNNKLALLGALRASAQSVSYEVTFGLTLVGMMMVFGTLQLDQMVVGQGKLLWGFLPKWGVFMQPLGMILFFTAALAENKRIPFDLPEGESEIVGYFVEYSSMAFGLFMTALKFIEMVVIAFMTTTLFFGGYLVPGCDFKSWPMWAATLIQFGAFMLKVIILLFLQFVIRWALPRFRYDQLMRLGWKILLPLSLANIGITAVAMLLDPSDELVAVIGLATIAVFILSLFYTPIVKQQLAAPHASVPHSGGPHTAVTHTTVAHTTVAAH